jgi:SprT protein
MLRQQIIDKVEESFKIAESYYGRTFTRPKHIVFKTTGRALGHCCYSRSELMFNLSYCEQNPTEFISVTCPHEVAHWIDHELYGVQYAGRKTIHHGRTWANIMIRVFKLAPERCADNYEVVRTRNITTYDYICKCSGRVHKISSTIHNRITQTKRFYTCKNCRSRIVVKPETATDILNEINKLQQQIAQLQNV